MNYENDFRALQHYVLTHPNWEYELKHTPYFLKIKRAPYNPNWVMFTYVIFDTDFSLPEVRASRGSIFELPTMKPICLPFYVFRNWNELCHDDIDWDSAKVELKVDGSMIKCVKHDGKVWWFTNGNTFTETNLMLKWHEADEPESENARTYHDLIEVALNKKPRDWIDKIPEDVTFMFELVSPRNVIIVPYDKTEFWFLGARDNSSMLEIDRDEAKSKYGIPFEVPPVIDAHDIKSLQETVKTWRGDKEGVVVVDKNFRRIKVKTDLYLNVKFTKAAADLSLKRVYTLIRNGTIDDAIALTPELAPRAEYMQGLIRKYDDLYWKCIEESKKYIATLPKNADAHTACFEKYKDTPDFSKYMLGINSDDSIVSELARTPWVRFRNFFNLTDN